MSSRAEEKARRRAEREEAERKAASKAAATRRLQIVGGVVLALAAVGAVVLVIAGGGGGNSDAAPSTSVASAAKLPAVRETDLNVAAKAAGCQLLNPPNEGSTHTDKIVTYKNSNPPASGPHNPVPAEDGIYAPGNEPTKEHWVHSLEHGRIEFQYKPGTPRATIDQIETLASEPLNGTPGYHTLTLQNNTNMPYAVAAIAWDHILACKTMTPRFFDAARAFRKTYTDKGPEIIP